MYYIFEYNICRTILNIYMITGKFPNLRLRRLRKFSWSRKLIQENNLSSSDLIFPLFVIEGKNKNSSLKATHREAKPRIDEGLENNGKIVVQEPVPGFITIVRVKSRAPPSAEFPGRVVKCPSKCATATW